MKKIVQDFKLSKVENSEKYFMEINNNQFYVGELVAHILELMKEGKGQIEIMDSINNKFCPEDPIGLDDFEEILSEHIDPLGVFNEEIVNEPKVFDEVKWRRTILNSDLICKISKPFQFFYQPIFFFVSFIAFMIINVSFLRQIPLSLESFDFGVYSLFSLPIIYSCMFLILIFHELGHATATLKFGIKPHNIGVGIYFFLPVLFTDITKVWQLSKLKKVIINLAGIYNQMMVNTVLFGLYSITRDPSLKTLIAYLTMASMSIILINLIPFVKYDAYWLYSDITDSRNLSDNSKSYGFDLLKKLISPGYKMKNHGIALKIYSIIKIGIFGLMYVFVLKMGYEEIQNMDEIISIFKYFTFSLISVLYVSRTVFVFLFLGYVVINLMKIVFFIFKEYGEEYKVKIQNG